MDQGIEIGRWEAFVDLWMWIWLHRVAPQTEVPFGGAVPHDDRCHFAIALGHIQSAVLYM